MVKFKPMKPKFRFHLSQGFSVTDKNKLRTLKQAESFARLHNQATPKIRKQFGGKITRITLIKRRKKK